MIRTSLHSGLQPSQWGNKKRFIIEKGRNCNYSVTQQQLLNRNRVMAADQRQRAGSTVTMPRQSMQSRPTNLEREQSNEFEMLPGRDEVEEEIKTLEDDMNEDYDYGALQTFKNAVVIGVQLNGKDVINSIDMNEISRNDPYVFNVSSTYSGVPVSSSRTDPFADLRSSVQDGEDPEEIRHAKMRANQLLERY